MYDSLSLTCPIYQVVQRAGQVLFVPSGWHHQVTNLEPTMSLNHNWVNHFNISKLVSIILADYEEACHVLYDLIDVFTPTEMYIETQRLLRTNSALDIADVYLMIAMACADAIAVLCMHAVDEGVLEDCVLIWGAPERTADTCVPALLCSQLPLDPDTKQQWATAVVNISQRMLQQIVEALVRACSLSLEPLGACPGQRAFDWDIRAAVEQRGPHVLAAIAQCAADDCSTILKHLSSNRESKV